jgi:hypothetical protein
MNNFLIGDIPALVLRFCGDTVRNYTGIPSRKTRGYREGQQEGRKEV